MKLIVGMFKHIEKSVLKLWYFQFLLELTFQWERPVLSQNVKKITKVNELGNGGGRVGNIR